MANRLSGRSRLMLPSPTGPRSELPTLGLLACPKFDYSKYRLADSFYDCANFDADAASLSGGRLRHVAS